MCMCVYAHMCAHMCMCLRTCMRVCSLVDMVDFTTSCYLWADFCLWPWEGEYRDIALPAYYGSLLDTKWCHFASVLLRGSNPCIATEMLVLLLSEMIASGRTVHGCGAIPWHVPTAVAAAVWIQAESGWTIWLPPRHSPDRSPSSPQDLIAIGAWLFSHTQCTASVEIYTC